MNFNGIGSPLTNFKTRKVFTWIKAIEISFTQLKRRIIEDLTFAIPNFKKLSTIECDASKVAVKGVLRQGKPMAFFSEK